MDRHATCHVYTSTSDISCSVFTFDHLKKGILRMSFVPYAHVIYKSSSQPTLMTSAF